MKVDLNLLKNTRLQTYYSLLLFLTFLTCFFSPVAAKANSSLIYKDLFFEKTSKQLKSPMLLADAINTRVFSGRLNNFHIINGFLVEFNSSRIFFEEGKKRLEEEIQKLSTFQSLSARILTIDDSIFKEQKKLELQEIKFFLKNEIELEQPNLDFSKSIAPLNFQ
jgi:hypothetical protein